MISDGVRVDDAQNQSIVGLYAAGETVGTYNTGRPSASYHGGSLHRGCTFSYTTALSAAEDFTL